jgi:hypothetical protein
VNCERVFSQKVIPTYFNGVKSRLSLIGVTGHITTVFDLKLQQFE